MNGSSDTLYQTLLPAGSHWSMRVKSGSAVRLTDVAGNANLGMLFTIQKICWKGTTHPTP